ncbi:PEP-CTERM sorting domain-containing protein [Dapis sp. BLCC M126]|uniref:PEP-CTERM sorting domain-containing protein n=1 Tax=Dapis sp. BLCC M126 TaxID=3400189 RepID=UPI003CF78637
MKNISQISSTILATLLTLSIGNSVEAASITWSNGPNFGGVEGFESIDTTGSLVEAVNLGRTGPLTVDPTGLNITFTPEDKLGAYFFMSGSPSSNDSAWNTIINEADFNGFNGTFDNFFTDLTVGQTYQVQLFASDTRLGGNIPTRTQYFHDGLGNQSSTFLQSSFTSIIGTFTADATTQSLGISASSNGIGGNDPILSAYVLRDITPTENTTSVPEPTSTLALLGAAGTGLLASRRKR